MPKFAQNSAPKRNLNTVERLKNYAFRILGQRPYASRRMEEKLRARTPEGGAKWGAEGGAGGEEGEQLVATVMARLHELNFLNDQTFAENFIRSRMQTAPRGKFLLQRELHQKGIAKEVFEKVWEGMKGDATMDEHQLALKVLQKKHRIIQKAPVEKRRQKMMMILAAKGFPTDVIAEVVKKEC